MPRVKNERHLALIRKLPCLCCFQHPVEAAHVRYGEPDRGKPMTGISEKPDDKWALPLCERHHRTGADAQHGTNERQWWADRGVDPIAFCEALYACKTFYEMETVFFNLAVKTW